MFDFRDICWADDPELCWVDDMVDPGHDYLDPEDEDNYDMCGETTYDDAA